MPGTPDSRPILGEQKNHQEGNADQFPSPKAQRWGGARGEANEMAASRQQDPLRSKAAIPRFAADPKQSPPKRKKWWGPPNLGLAPEVPILGNGTFGANTKPKSEGNADRFPLLHGL